MKLVVDHQTLQARRGAPGTDLHGCARHDHVGEIKGFGTPKAVPEVCVTRCGQFPAQAAHRGRRFLDIADKAIEVDTAGQTRAEQIGDGKIFVTPIDHALRIRVNRQRRALGGFPLS